MTFWRGFRSLEDPSEASRQTRQGATSASGADWVLVRVHQVLRIQTHAWFGNLLGSPGTEAPGCAARIVIREEVSAFDLGCPAIRWIVGRKACTSQGATAVEGKCYPTERVRMREACCPIALQRPNLRHGRRPLGLRGRLGASEMLAKATEFRQRDAPLILPKNLARAFRRTTAGPTSSACAPACSNCAGG